MGKDGIRGMIALLGVLITFAGLFAFALVLQSLPLGRATATTSNVIALPSSLYEVESPVMDEARLIEASVPRQELEVQRLDTPDLLRSLQALQGNTQSALYIQNPQFSPYSDKYIFSTLVNGRPMGLWLASVSEGIQRQLLKDVQVNYVWGHDDQHIVYAQWPELTKDPFDPHTSSPQPVFLFDLATGERTELGIAEPVWRMQASTSGDIAFLRDDTLHIVNPVLGVRRQVSSAFTVGHPVHLPSEQRPDNINSEVIPDFLSSKPNSATPLPTEIPQGEDVLKFSELYPTTQIRFALSPDGRKVVLHQVMYDKGALVIVDLETQRSTLITNEAGNSWQPYAWSPDGAELAYATVSEETRIPALWIVDVENGQSMSLITNANRRGRYEWLAWHPNAQDILFAFSPGGTAGSTLGGQYQIINAKGGQPYTILTNGAMLSLFDGGKNLAFYREEESNNQTEIHYWTSTSLLKAQ